MFTTMDEVREANKAAGRYWFEPLTMQFFRSRVGSELYDGKYFVSSERRSRFPHGRYPRRYTIREAHIDGGISTVSRLQEYPSRNAAIRAIKRILKEGIT